MAQAIRTQNYQGVLVYVQNGRMESMGIVHRYQNGREQERMHTLSGELREIHRDNQTVTCLLPKDRSVKMEKPGLDGLLPALSPDTLQQVNASYEVVERGATRMVGRDCREIMVKPRDQFRYGYRMWVDEATAVPLKIELVAGDGDVLEQVMFTNIEYPAVIDDAALRTNIDPQRFVRVQHGSPKGSSRVVQGSWTVERLPQGFRQASQDFQRLPGAEDPVEHMLFTDGLASVSVFVAPAGKPKAFKGMSHMGAVNAYGKMIGNYHVTVVGEVPRATVERIGDGLRYTAASAPASATQ
jgi:sigma-E factor negative regulatory protein RseB